MCCRRGLGAGFSSYERLKTIVRIGPMKYKTVVYETYH